MKIKNIIKIFKTLTMIYVICMVLVYFKAKVFQVSFLISLPKFNSVCFFINLLFGCHKD